MKKEEFIEQIKSPQWQKRRLEIMQRDDFTCQHCLSKNRTLTVHHKMYIKGRKYWEYEDDCLITLCERCHKYEHDYKNELYDEFSRIITQFEKYGLSYNLLSCLIAALDPEMLEESPETLSKTIVDFMGYETCGVQNYSDLIALEKLDARYDFSELKRYMLENFK